MVEQALVEQMVQVNWMEDALDAKWIKRIVWSMIMAECIYANHLKLPWPDRP